MTDQISELIGITDHELVALADMNPTPIGRRFLEALGLAEFEGDERVIRAGQATLLVREVAGITGDSIVAQAFAEAIATMVTGANQVVALTLSAPAMLTSRSIMIDGPSGGLLLDLTAFGVHAAQPLGPGVTSLGLVRDILDNLGDDLPLEAEMVVYRGEDEPRTAVFGVITSEMWEMDGAQVPADAAWKKVMAAL